VKRPSADLEERILGWIRGISPADFGEMTAALHAFQFCHNAPYRRFCEETGVGDLVEHWRQIPCVPQEAFKHADLRSFSAGETAKTFRTSGTTGEGYGQHHFRTLEIYEAAVREGWQQTDMPPGPYLVIAPHPEEAPYSSLSQMLAILAPRKAFIAHDGQVDLARLKSVDKPICFLGTALGFMNLFEQMDKAGVTISLPPGSRAMETGGYKGSGRNISRADLYAMFGDKLGIAPDDIYNEYGMTELSSQFYARGPQGLHHGPPWARAVVADPVTLAEVSEGETGILLIYDAANVGSVVGIRTQDLAVKRGEAFELLGRDPAAIPRGCSRAADEWMSR